VTPYQQEQIEILRRIAERGKTLALEHWSGMRFVDIFQHLLDEIERLAKS
jgi:hypothetical protein